MHIVMHNIYIYIYLYIYIYTLFFAHLPGHYCNLWPISFTNAAIASVLISPVDPYGAHGEGGACGAFRQRGIEELQYILGLGELLI